MFSKPRPVPSPAALKVLYQLAYISSGTAVGLAALCAEERRRRIQIVQRIADNAKALRQHPRHIQNAALAVNDGEEDGFFGKTLVAEEISGRRRRRTRTSRNVDELNGTAFKGPLLPSIVENEYGDTFGSGHSPRRRCGGQSKLGDSIARLPVQAHSIAVGDTSSQHASAQDNRPDQSRKEAGNQHGDAHQLHKLDPYNVFMSVPLFQEGDFITKKARTLSQRFRSKFMNHSGNSAISSYVTKPAWDTHLQCDDNTTTDNIEPDRHKIDAGISLVSTEDITHDIDIFFEFGPPRAIPKLRVEAHQLLTLALKKGSLDDIRSLCFWMLDSGSFSIDQGRHLISTHEDLVSRFNRCEVFNFYADVFASPRYQRLDPMETLKQVLQILIIASHWNLGLTLGEIARAILVNSFRFVEIENVVAAVTTECRALLLNGEVSLAVDFLIVCTGRWPQKDLHQRDLFIPLADEVLAATLDNEHLAACQRMLRWRFRSPQALGNLRQHFNEFVKACARRSRFGLLLDLLRKGKLGVPSAQLMKMSDDFSKAVLAVACSTDAQSTSNFQSLYREVPQQYRSYVTESSALMGLNSKWKSSRNLDAIEVEVPLLKKWLVENGDDQSLRKLDEALLEIYISAGKIDRSLDTIARIHQNSEASSVTFSLAALLFAKRGAWDRLTRLLEIAQHAKSLQFNAHTTNLFNEVIRLFSVQHSAVEAWNFVTDAMEKLRFVPNVPTRLILLKCFISNDSIHLIPRWLASIHAVGYGLKLTARVAADLLNTYYLEKRPGHVMMFHFCRALISAVPSMEPGAFRNLLKEATGYDMRQYFGRNWYLQLHAQARMQRLEAVSGYIPDPGWLNNRQLCFPNDGEMSRHALRSPASEQTNSTRQPGNVMQRSPITTFEDSKSPSDRFESDRAEHKTPAPSTTLVQHLESVPAESDMSQHGSVPFGGAYLNADEGVRSKEINREFHERVPDEAGYPLQRSAPDTEERYHEIIAAYNEGTEVPALLETDSLDGDAAFQNLRSEYNQENPIRDAVPESVRDKGDMQSLERDMIFALSVCQYQKVLVLYEKSCDAIGLPASVRTLEVAVEASLRLHGGNRAHAEELMRAARDAGMNTTCAMGPLLIHQMKTLNFKVREDVNRLRTTVIEYYRMNDENGWGVNHHVGVTAANQVIVHGRPEYGVNILSAIYQSEWAARRPLDIVGMTVFLKGYELLQSLKGIRWVVRTVLQDNMRITKRFLVQLRDCYRRPRLHILRKKRALLMSWAQHCRERQMEQMKDSLRLGNELVDCIVKCATEQEQLRTGLSEPFGADHAAELKDHLGRDEEKTASAVPEVLDAAVTPSSPGTDLTDPPEAGTGD